MTTPNDITTFNDVCENHSTWIIKYCSATFGNPLFLVWYTDTDENSTDRLLTYPGGAIFAVESLGELKPTLLSAINNLVVFDNLSPWLEDFKNLEVVECSVYDLIAVTNNLDNNILDIKTIEGVADFINLFGDFINQDERNSHLQAYADDALIKAAWNYFYDFIFWPEFNDKEKFEAWDRPRLEIDAKELSIKLKEVIKSFDDHIKLSEEAIYSPKF